MLAEGYRKGAVWARFSLAAPAAPNQWLLEIERPLIEHVEFYVPDGSGQFTEAPLGQPGENTTRTVSAYPALRSDEHTSELQSLMRISYAVFCLKKNMLI